MTSRPRRTRTGMVYPLPPAEVPLCGYGAQETVSIVLKISAVITSGSLQRGDLENWFKAAIMQYHSAKGGKIGYSHLATVERPTCVRCDTVVD